MNAQDNMFVRMFVATILVVTVLAVSSNAYATPSCDDGNRVNGDGCSSACQVEVGWDCNIVGTVDSVCFPICGDSIVLGGEACDDGNRSNQDGCSSRCTLEAGFTCSDGSPTLCSRNCGNGRIDGTEACDDSNVTDGDGCSATCAIEGGWDCTWTRNGTVCNPVCGDGVVVDGETCDDDNTTDGDGCSATCSVESSYTCTGFPSVCESECGDGVLGGCSEEQTSTQPRTRRQRTQRSTQRSHHSEPAQTDSNNSSTNNSVFAGPCPAVPNGHDLSEYVIWSGGDGQHPAYGELMCPATLLICVRGTSSSTSEREQRRIDGGRAFAVASPGWDGRWFALAGTPTNEAIVACIPRLEITADFIGGDSGGGLTVDQTSLEVTIVGAPTYVSVGPTVAITPEGLYFGGELGVSLAFDGEDGDSPYFNVEAFAAYSPSGGFGWGGQVSTTWNVAGDWLEMGPALSAVVDAGDLSGNREIMAGGGLDLRAYLGALYLQVTPAYGVQVLDDPETSGESEYSGQFFGTGSIGARF